MANIDCLPSSVLNILPVLDSTRWSVRLTSLSSLGLPVRADMEEVVELGLLSGDLLELV